MQAKYTYNPSEQESHKPSPSQEVVHFEAPQTLSLGEVAARNREEFQTLIGSANIRTLVRYVEDCGATIDKIPEISGAWKSYFSRPDFLITSYAWRNPKLYLLDKKSAGAMALSELLKRLADSQPPK